MSGALTQGVFPWSEEAIALLREWRGQGMSCGQIAGQLSAKFRLPVSRSAVIGKASRLKISAPSRIASSAAAKINRAAKAPRQIMTPRERAMPEEVATRRVVDLIRAENRDAAPALERQSSDVVSAAPCCLPDLTFRSCRWPLSQAADDGQARFCNNDKLVTGPYCEGHAKRAFKRVISKEQRNAERVTLERHRAEARAAGLTDRVFGFGMAKRFA